MDLSAFYNQFREETAENIRAMGDSLLAIEAAADDDVARRAALDRAFRAVHTVKGSARMLGFAPVGDLAHTMESLLGELREGQRSLDSSLANALLRSGDALLSLANAATEGRTLPLDVDALIASLEQNSAEPAPPASSVGTDTGRPENSDSAENKPATLSPARDTGEAGSPAPLAPSSPTPARSQPRQTIRVRVDRLDRMLNLAGELTVSQQVLANHSEQLEMLRQLVEQHERALEALEAELNRLRFSAGQRQALDSRLGAVRDAAGQARTMLDRQSERFARHASQHNLLVKDLEQEVMAARLLPIATVYAGLPRATRDLAQATGREVQLQLYGEATELDRKVLELINDPLLHLLRNAIDHGIELPAARVAAGKPPTGTIEVSAEATGGDVRVMVSDDGRGIDPQQLRERAVRLGLLNTEQAARLPDSEALDLIFQPGFSTASIVTDISGRGVGMDVVRSNITELGGQIQVESQAGHGTRVVLVLPLTLLTTRVLLVQLGRSRFALPATSCQGTLWVRRRDIRNLEGQPTIAHEGRTVAVLNMADLVGVDGSAPFTRAERARAVLVGSGQRSVALLVDALLDEREAVIKPLGALLAGRNAYSGAVQLGEGSLVLLLNPLLLLQQRPGRGLVQPVPARPSRQPHLLVVDDSFTTRELIRSILQSAGYLVTAAVDGADALDKLHARAYDLVVSDVEMPRVDGFQLTSHIRSLPGLADLPVVLITSLASESHRRQGLEVGAQAYIVKSQFNQEGLLEVIRQLLDHDS